MSGVRGWTILLVGRPLDGRLVHWRDGAPARHADALPAFIDAERSNPPHVRARYRPAVATDEERLRGLNMAVYAIESHVGEVAVERFLGARLLDPQSPWRLFFAWPWSRTQGD